jgi:hypothetical protein
MLSKSNAFLSIWILPLLHVFLYLLQMSLLGVFSDLSLLSLVVPICEDLHSSELFLLKGPHLLLLLLKLLGLLLFHDLLLSLVEDLSFLIIIETFEVVGLHSMVSQLGLGCHWILSHEVISGSVVDFMVLLMRPILSLLVVLVSLLLGLL